MPEPNNKMNWNIILQVVLAIIIVLILYIVTLVIIDTDSIIVTSTNTVMPREKTVILDGYASTSFLSKKKYNTFNPYVDNFVKIGRSINSFGGSQFTYQFWIKIDNPTDEYFKDLVILLKGDTRKYKIGLYNQNNQLMYSVSEPDIAIACPIIFFGESYRDLRVGFNTSKGPGVVIDINMNPDESILSRRNVTSLLALSKWFMMTFVFEDNYSIASGTENGINFRFYIDDFRYQTNTPTDVSLNMNTLQQNDGDLNLMINSTEHNFMKMGNLTYYNYALNDDEVRQSYANGAPTKDISLSESRNNKPPFLTAYNKIDIYNY
jgi:hypothetical protein